MMDLNNFLFKSKFCSYEPINMDDCKSIIDIRSSRNDSVLNTIDNSLEAQKEYFNSYQKRYKKNRKSIIKYFTTTRKTI